jgi:DNA repair protein RadC
MEDHNNNWEIGNLGEVSISYVYKGNLNDRPKISECYDAYQIAMSVMDKGKLGLQEQFLVIYLNRSNRVIGAKVHFIGGVSSVFVDTKIIAATAIGLLASAVILVHNHPSGSLEPSEHDKSTTVKLKEALDLLDIQVIDHLIIAPDGEWLSFIQKGLL